MMQTNTVYDKKWLVWCLIGIVAMCGAMKATGGVGFVLIFPLVLFGFCKSRPELLFYSILMTAMITVTNGAIAPKGALFPIMARLVYLLVGGALVLQMVGRRAPKVLTPLLALMPFLIYMAIVSSVGWQPIISYLKLLLFTVVFLAFYSASYQSICSPSASVRCMRSVMLAVAVFMLVGSFLLIPFPAISMMDAASFFQMHGYLPDGGLFQGIVFHSQALGPLLAVFAVLLLADLLFSVRRREWLYIVLLCIIPMLIYKTGSRTAMGTLLAGVFFVVLIFVQANAREVGYRWRQRTLSVLVMLGIVGGVALMATPQMRSAVLSFAFKTGGRAVAKENVTFENLTLSRKGLVDNAVENFKTSPWIGNGFQVSEHHAEMQIVDWKQLLSAPIEKGVWIYAIPEEGGAFGMALFLIFIVTAFSGLLKSHGYIGVALLFTFLVANLGEFGFFSMSTWGGLVWGMIFAGLALDAQRERDRLMAYLGPAIRLS